MPNPSPDPRRNPPKVPADSLPKTSPAAMAEPEVTAPMPGFKRLSEEELRPASPTPDGSADPSRDLDPPREWGPIPELPTEPAGWRGRFKLPSLSSNRTIDKATRDALYEVFARVLETTGKLIQLRMASPQRYGPTDVFLFDRQDTETIGGALANMAARRTPDGLGGDTDAADLIQLGIGTAGYSLKNLTKRAQLRALLESGAWSDLERAGAGVPGGVASADDLAAAYGSGD